MNLLGLSLGSCKVGRASHNLAAWPGASRASFVCIRRAGIVVIYFAYYNLFSFSVVRRLGGNYVAADLSRCLEYVNGNLHSLGRVSAQVGE